MPYQHILIILSFNCSANISSISIQFQIRSFKFTHGLLSWVFCSSVFYFAFNRPTQTLSSSSLCSRIQTTTQFSIHCQPHKQPTTTTTTTTPAKPHTTISIRRRVTNSPKTLRHSLSPPTRITILRVQTDTTNNHIRMQTRAPSQITITKALT